MRIRHAATALVALGAVSACAIGATLIHRDGVEADARESALRSSSWSLEASTDFGTTWAAPISSSGGHFPVRVDTAALRNQPAYQPFTLRTSVDSRNEALVTLRPGVLVDGDPATAAEVRVRAVSSEQGTCAAPTFARGAAGLLAGDATRPLPVNAPTADEPVVLPGATRTTPGAPETLCLEVSIAPNAPVADSVLTLAWPLDIARDDADA